ncbi:uncharacterized protein LOC101859026 [Aplysia californica]|uniref:Uncharacterized protein LOC101859026 n=1 Tax=Aplysia californica TaxID=6500 RepID=A0ABM1A3T6_APLCA|nr:uncharacterized protein LOC101859026 [Aplysia californica]
MGKKDHDVISQFKVADSDSNRMFIMEGPVQLASGMQVQERYIFLFTDLLLVAKQKSSTAFKLKNRVQLCDMWIASCIEEVSETTRPPERSFVLGWPTTNVVATFPKAEHKDEWLLKLSERITEEKLRDEKKNIQLKVTPRDVGPSSCPACQMTINNVTQAKDVLLACLRQLSIEENEAKDYQLWVISGKEGSPYPLIGHETPFSIKLSQVRELTRSRSRDDLDKMTSGDLDTVVEDTNSSSGHRCEFFLKQKKTPKKNHLDNSSYQKSMKRSKKSPNIINTLLRKIRPPQPLVFGLPLADICDDDFQPPESILRLMVLVYRRGPEICGIMRRGNNAQLCKEIKEKIKSGLTYTVEDHQAPTAASVYKEFLRSIPGGLLMTEFHDQWVRVQKEEQDDVKIEKIKTILSQVPPAHYCLIKLSICLLQHLAKHCEVNCMGPSNLATCIAPSFCKLDLPNTKHASDLEHVQSSLHEITTIFTPLISFMIIKHIEIFGEDILEMFVKFGCESSPSSRLDEDRTDSGLTTNTEEEEEEEEEEDEMMVEDEDEMEEEDDEDYSNHQQLPKRHRLQLQKQQPQRQHIQRDSNSGTDSDSMHSVLSMPDTAMGLRRDDSSIDSLVDREYYPNETESSPKATKSHLSPSNLSRDSGLTLSDTQLYDEDALHHDMASKNYQRSASHFEGHELELHEAGYYSRSMDMRHDRRVNPVPPPRKRASKKPHDAHSIYELDHQGYHIAASSYHHRPPFKHSASTTQLDISQPRKGGELRPMLTHPPFGKRISSDSIGEEEETQGPQNPIDFNKIRKAPDIGTIVKTDSGTHLFLGDEMLPTKYNLGPAAVKMQQGRDRFIRQSSVTDSTPPVSPQSRYSQSSRDSVLSDSTYSMSRDGSVHSAPHTPDEPPGKSLSWMREHELSFKQWDGRLAHSMNASTLPLSKSTSDLLGANYEEEEETSDQFGTGASNKLTRMYKPSSPKPWSRKSHEAEEIEMNRRPHFSLMVPSEDFSSEQASRRQSSPAYSRQTLAQQLVKGSPPPNVILKSLQPPQARRESVPMKASYDREIVDQVRRSSADFAENSPFDVAKSMSSIKPAEYFSVTSKEIMIPSPDDGDSSSSSSNVNKLKLSKYVSSNVDLPLTSKDKDSVLADSKRPDRPPNYQQALQRNFMLKHSIPVDITSDETEKQKEVSARAKALYEKSVQRYNEQRTGKPVEGHNSSQGQGVESKVGAASSSASITPLDNNPRSKTESVIDKSSSDGETIFAHSALSALPKNSHQLDVESSSAFLDMGTISRSLQEDVLNQRNALAKEELSSADGSFYGDRSISRTSSKLSDTGSSSGSSVTVSTLSRHSDSFSRHSDISNVSNVTVSSVTSSDSSTDAHSIKSQRRSGSELDLRSMAYSRHFRPVEAEKLSPPCDQEIPRRRSSGAIDEEDIYVTLQNKNPKQVYLESKRMFEEDDPVVQPSVSFSSHPSQEQSSTQPSSHSPSSSHLPLSSSQSPQHSPHISSSPKSSSLPSAEQTYSVKTSLEVPSSSLQRSRSDSAEHINKLGKLSPRLQTSNRLAQVTQGKGSSLEDSQLSVARFEEHSATVKKSFDKKPPSSDLSEHRHNFLKARSYFYHPEDDKLASPNASPRPSASSSYAASSLSSSNSSLPSNSAITVRKIPAENVANIPSYEDKTVDSGYNLSPRSRSNIPASRTAHDKHVDKKDPPPSASSVSQSKKEFPWSVKDLKSIYDKDKGPSSLSKGATSTQSTSTSSSSSSSSLTTRSQQQQQQQHRNPPPYQDPPPFRRMQDKYRLSTSSNSSAGSDQGSSARKLSTSSGNDPHRLGPQSNGLDGASYWSSSEDGYSSSLDRRSVKSSSSSNPDVEAISDYSNITYV